MPRSAPLFKDRRKRPWRPKKKFRPPAPPGCCRKRLKHTTKTDNCEKNACNYLDSRPVFPQKFTISAPYLALLIVLPRLCLVAEGGSMEDEELPLTGEFLRSICAALHRNGIRSLKRAAIVPDLEEQSMLKKPPDTERRPQLLTTEGDGHVFAPRR